jgi:uncharacterized protein YvpB
MILAYLGQPKPYETLTKVLGTRWFGTPVDNILQLDQLGIQVVIEEMTLEEISSYLEQGLPVMAFINTADLPYWNVSSDHVVVVIGMDEQWIYVNDPYFPQAPQQVSQTSFELAQLRFDNRCAVVLA